MLARTLWDNWYNNRRFAHVYMQSGGPNRERLYRAGFNPTRVDQTGGRWVDQMGGRTGCGLS